VNDHDLRPSQLLKFKFIKQEAFRGNVLAQRYRKVSIDWAHRVLINRIREQNERIKNIISEMKKQGLDPNNEEDLRGYLNKYYSYIPLPRNKYYSYIN